MTIAPFLVFGQAMAKISLNIETGIVSSGYNDVRIPNKTGTLFSLTDDLKTNSQNYYRVNLNYDLTEKDHFSLLFAPLSLDANGSVGKNIFYENTTFDAGSALKATYKFNSYRLTYRRALIENEKLLFGLGLTGKIRDAAISLESETAKAEKKNVGFVPLVNFLFRVNLNDRFFVSVDGDALAAPQGRAEDILLSLNYSPNHFIGSYIGYRILEGGANVDSVYNFALLNYLAFGLSIRL